jgi:hypothetical protein
MTKDRECASGDRVGVSAEAFELNRQMSSWLQAEGEEVAEKAMLTYVLFGVTAKNFRQI